MLKQKVYQFTCHFIPDEEAGGFVVEVPTLPGCLTQGDTFEEAKADIKEAIELYCEVFIKRGLPLIMIKDDNSICQPVIPLKPFFPIIEIPNQILPVENWVLTG